MATIQTLVDRSRRKLRGTRREPFNVLGEPFLAGTDELVLANPVGDRNSISAGDYLCIGAEIMLVTSVDAPAGHVTVEREVDGTTAPATHEAGARVEINWRWMTADLLTDLADEVRSWGDGIFTVASADVSIGTGTRSVDLPLTRFRYPLELRRKSTGREWVGVPVKQYRIETNMPTSQFSSGNALIVVSSLSALAAQYNLIYAQSFDISALEVLETDLEDIGITATLFDAAIYGVAFRALAGDEAGRVDEIAQPEPRDAAEVEPFDAMRAASAFKAIRDLRIAEEAMRLRTLYRLKVA